MSSGQFRPSPLISVNQWRPPDKIDDSLSRSRADGFFIDHDDLVAWQQLPLRRTTYIHRRQPWQQQISDASLWRVSFSSLLCNIWHASFQLTGHWRESTVPGVTERTTTGFSLPATKPNPRTGSRLISTRRGAGGTPSRGTSSRELLCDTWLKKTG